MVVDDPAGLHRRVDGRRPDEAEARLAQLLRERLRAGRLREPVVRASAAPGPSTRYDQTSSGSGALGIAQRDRRARVGDRGLDLAAVPDDPGVGEQPLDVRLAELGDALGVEARERRAEVLALAQDRQPREPGLEALQAEALVQPALVHHRPAPLLVVVAVVRLVGALPAALAHQAIVTLTMPSSTRTGKVSTGHDRRQRERPAGADLDPRAVARADRVRPPRRRSRPRRAARRRASSGPRSRSSARPGCRRRPRSRPRGRSSPSRAAAPRPARRRSSAMLAAT